MLQQCKEMNPRLATSLFILLYACQVIHATKCHGEHQYIAANGNCEFCEMCPPGYEPTDAHCGYGDKDSRYACKPCDAGSYSLTRDYNFCITCSPCERWHSTVSSKCTSTSNSVCGACHPGYFRPQKADGGSDVECHKCNGDSDSSCRTTNWLLIVILLSVFCFIAFLAAFILGFLFRRSRIATEKSKPQGPSQSSSCNTSTISTSCEILTSLTSQPLNNRSSQQIETNKHLLIELDTDTYSNRPTAQFSPSLVHYHNMPTAQFNSNQSDTVRNGASCFGSVDQLRRDIDVFDTTSVSNPSTSIQLVG